MSHHYFTNGRTFGPGGQGYLIARRPTQGNKRADAPAEMPQGKEAQWLPAINVIFDISRNGDLGTGYRSPPAGRPGRHRIKRSSDKESASMRTNIAA